MALSDLAVRKAKATGKAYTLPDSDGLTLAVNADGGKSWHFRYYWNDRQKRMSLGIYPEVGLREARALRDEARSLLARGINPRVHRKEKRQAVKLADENTFGAVYDKWVKHRELVLKEGRQMTLTQIRRVFGKDVLPFLGKRTLYEIRRADLLDVVARIERRKAYSVAEKVRTWFNQMFRYALVIVPGLDVNPASDLDVVAVPQPPVRHNPFLRMNELPTLLQMLRTYPGMLQTQLGIRLLLLTGGRTGELRQATPDQFDLDRGLWIIPPQNVKQLQLQMRKDVKQTKAIPPYIVPLSVQAIEVVRHMLQQRVPDQRYLFAHWCDPRKRMSENTINAGLKRLGYKDRLTGHGIRATISTALNEIGYPRIWVDAQLSHADPDKVSSAYNHADYVGQRRRMMQDWADRLDLFERNRIEQASMHLSIDMLGVPVLEEERGETGAAEAAFPADSLVAKTQTEFEKALSAATRLPAVVLPSEALQPELSDFQRERKEMLDIYESAHMLSVTTFAKAAGKSRQSINYDVRAEKLLALEIGNQGRRIPDWHFDPLRHELIQAVLKHAGNADGWDIYRALTRPHDLLEGAVPIEAVTSENYPEALMAVCFALREENARAELLAA